MRIAVYGGSFDPLHVGHLMVATWLRWTDQADEVWLVVSHHHPFGKETTPYGTRLAWCRAVVEGLPGLEVSDIEGRLPEPNYTIDVLEALRRDHPEHTFRFVLGSDAFASTDRWHRWPDVVADFAPLVVARAGYPRPEGYDGPVFPEVASTDVRERVRRGQSIASLVPRQIHDLVLRHYGPPGDADALPSS